MTEKILDILKNSNDFISGEVIAKELKVSRVSISKNIKKLKDMGYDIKSVTNKGYILIKDNKLFNKFEIEKQINTKVLGNKVYFFDEISSTNEYAKSLANSNEEEGAIVIADCQTNGKGRLDKKWESNKGEGLFMSILLRPNVHINNIVQITLLSGICICNGIKKATGLDASIKWPNDIVVNGKKVCGILTELSAQIENVSYVILGIGINVNNKNFNDELKDKATSIFLETNKEIERAKLLSYILNELEEKYLKFKEIKDFTLFLPQYKALCVNLNKEVKAIYKNEEIIGTVVDISPLGEIILKTDKGMLNISSGFVSLRNVDGKYV